MPSGQHIDVGPNRRSLTTGDAIPA